MEELQKDIYLKRVTGSLAQGEDDALRKAGEWDICAAAKVWYILPSDGATYLSLPPFGVVYITEDEYNNQPALGPVGAFLRRFRLVGTESRQNKDNSNNQDPPSL